MLTGPEVNLLTIVGERVLTVLPVKDLTVHSAERSAARGLVRGLGLVPRLVLGPQRAAELV